MGYTSKNGLKENREVVEFGYKGGSIELVTSSSSTSQKIVKQDTKKSK